MSTNKDGKGQEPPSQASAEIHGWHRPGLMGRRAASQPPIPSGSFHRDGMLQVVTEMQATLSSTSLKKEGPLQAETKPQVAVSPASSQKKRPRLEEAMSQLSVSSASSQKKRPRRAESKPQPAVSSASSHGKGTPAAGPKREPVTEPMLGVELTSTTPLLPPWARWSTPVLSRREPVSEPMAGVELTSTTPLLPPWARWSTPVLEKSDPFSCPMTGVESTSTCASPPAQMFWQGASRTAWSPAAQPPTPPTPLQWLGPTQPFLTRVLAECEPLSDPMVEVESTSMPPAQKFRPGASRCIWSPVASEPSFPPAPLQWPWAAQLSSTPAPLQWPWASQPSTTPAPLQWPGAAQPSSTPAPLQWPWASQPSTTPAPLQWPGPSEPSFPPAPLQWPWAAQPSSTPAPLQWPGANQPSTTPAPLQWPGSSQPTSTPAPLKWLEAAKPSFTPAPLQWPWATQPPFPPAPSFPPVPRQSTCSSTEHTTFQGLGHVTKLIRRTETTELNFREGHRSRAAPMTSWDGPYFGPTLLRHSSRRPPGPATRDLNHIRAPPTNDDVRFDASPRPHAYLSRPTRPTPMRPPPAELSRKNLRGLPAWLARQVQRLVPTPATVFIVLVVLWLVLVVFTTVARRWEAEDDVVHGYFLEYEPRKWQLRT